jgi:N6-adenosine-specific RNA methylase IME4
MLPIAKNERGKIHSVFTEQVKEHSTKPEIAYRIIERLYPDAERLELYARKRREGWDAWGDEV